MVTENHEEHPPLAIVGMACRMSGGAETPERFWRSLRDVERRSDDKASHSRRGFDAGFFNLTTEQALATEPQERALLETAVEALEDAGIPLNDVVGTTTAILVGAGTGEGEPSRPVTLAERVASALELRGSSLSVDAGTSSWLVAIHLACQALWMGDSAIALAGGVNADDEGVGLLVLRPLSDAKDAGDRIYALVAASGVHHNSDADSAGVEELLRGVYARAGASPAEIQYVELSRSAESAEASAKDWSALRGVLAKARRESACFIGSLQTGPGVASALKAVLAVHHGEIPPSDLIQGPSGDSIEDLDVPNEVTSWPRPEGRRMASIVSIGDGGTDAHVVLQEFRARREHLQEVQTTTHEGPFILPISARSAAAHRALAEMYRQLLLAVDSPRLDDFLHSVSERRSHHSVRSGIVADSKADLIDELRAIGAGDAGEPTTGASPLSEVCFVYGGTPHARRGLAESLCAREPVFAEALEQVDAAFRRISGWSVTEVSSEAEAAPARGFAMHVALTELWGSWGIHPAAVVGHGVGEISAAYVSGALSLEEAALVAYHVSRVHDAIAGQGRTLAVSMAEAETEELLYGLEHQVSVASVDGYASVTLAGVPEAVNELAEMLAEEGISATLLESDAAYHSCQVDPFEEELLDRLRGLRPARPRLPIYSTVIGARVREAYCDGGYWWRNAREPVRFVHCVEGILQDGYRAFLEIGSHATLSPSIQSCARAKGVPVHCAASMDQDSSAPQSMLEALSRMYQHGADVSWKAVSRGHGKFVRLPFYPWQREPFDAARVPSGQPEQELPPCEKHPLIGSSTEGEIPSWETELSGSALDYLNDYYVGRSRVLPAAALAEIGLALGRPVGPGTACSVAQLTFHDLRSLAAPRERALRIRHDRRSREFAVHARGDVKDGWIECATGIVIQPSGEPTPSRDVSDIRDRCVEIRDTGAFYARVPHGSSFKRLKRIWKGRREALAEIASLDDLPHDESYRLHPAVLDAGFQALTMALDADEVSTFVPLAIDRLTSWDSTRGPSWVHVRVHWASTTALEGDIHFVNEDGQLHASVERARLEVARESADAQPVRQTSLTSRPATVV